MSFQSKKANPFELSSTAVEKIVNLSEQENGKYFRVYVTGEVARLSVWFQV